jgi:twitching motility protein PilI
MDRPLLTPSQALTGTFSAPLAPTVAPGSGAAQVQMRQGFRIGPLHLMVRYEDGSELTEMPRVYPLPKAPGWFRGVANLHGALIPVFDLARYAGIESAPAVKSMLLVLSHGADAAGVIIDGLPQRLRLTPDASADAASAPPSLAPHIRHAALIDDRVWFDLDRAALLDALEASLSTSH